MHVNHIFFGDAFSSVIVGNYMKAKTELTKFAFDNIDGKSLISIFLMEKKKKTRVRFLCWIKCIFFEIMSTNIFIVSGFR